MIYSLNRTHLNLGMVLGEVTQEQAQQLTDGPDGWSILEIMCHVRDYQEIYIERVQQIVNEDNPTLQVYDAEAREALISERDYAHQNLKAVFDNYCDTRQRFIQILSDLEEDQWLRVGQHPMTGTIDVSVPVFHAIMHDCDHTEQIARTLGMRLP
jgi:uncharacterized damage-inducible protein DinB